MDPKDVPVQGAVSATPEELAANIDSTLGLDPVAPVEGSDDAAGDGTGANAGDDAVVDGADGAVAPDAEGAGADGADAGTDDAAAGDAGDGDAAGTDGDGADDPDGTNDADNPDADAVAAGDAEDLFLEVEDAAGTKFKITKIEDLPEDFTPKNNRQVIEILAGLNKLEADTKAQADKQLAIAEAHQVEEQKTQQLTAWDNEISELQKGGRLEKPKAAAGSDKFLEDPAVKKVSDVFTFIAETNKARLEKGNPNMIRSFEDALDLFEAREARSSAAEKAKTDTAIAKEKAGVIGRGSAPAGNEPAPYVAGQANSIWDV